MSNSDLPAEWNNEAYVSLHLVQKMLHVAGLPSGRKPSGYAKLFLQMVKWTKRKNGC